jgi:phospholipid/cholesterol/gamma-HCH transport system permease protein
LQNKNNRNPFPGKTDDKKMNALPNSDQSETTYRLDHQTLYFENRLTLDEVQRNIDRIFSNLGEYADPILNIDVSQIRYIDSTGVAFLNQIRKQLIGRNINVNITNASAEIEKIINTFTIPEQKPLPTQPRNHLFERIGALVYHTFTVIMRDYLYLLADLFYWTFIDFLRSKSHRKGEFINQAVLIGVNAVPIVGLISFLIGAVLALQSAAQLRQFGANVFISDLIVIAIVREMGPLLTAIMIAGRSGSAIASEVATMVVMEEVDALKTMALNPVRYIIVPKMHASLFTFPFLTVLADVLGIVGGMLVAYFYLDLSFTVFYNRMVDVLYFKDIFTGILKSLIFAAIIVQTAAYFGFHVKGGAEGVGKYTTSAVVTSIFLVILADSIIGLIFY